MTKQRVFIFISTQHNQTSGRDVHDPPSSNTPRSRIRGQEAPSDSHCHGRTKMGALTMRVCEWTLLRGYLRPDWVSRTLLFQHSSHSSAPDPAPLPLFALLWRAPRAWALQFLPLSLSPNVVALMAMIMQFVMFLTLVSGPSPFLFNDWDRILWALSLVSLLLFVQTRRHSIRRVPLLNNCR